MVPNGLGLGPSAVTERRQVGRGRHAATSLPMGASTAGTGIPCDTSRCPGYDARERYR